MTKGSRMAALDFCCHKRSGARTASSSLPPCGTLTAAKGPQMEHRENPSSFPPEMPVPRRSGNGCIVQVLGALTLGAVLFFVIYAVFMPWAFYMGGHFHIFPQWTGWGRMHSNLAGDYILYVQLSPSARSSHTGHAVPHISGHGFLCTPRGETYKLRLGGDFGKASGTDLQGKSAYLYMNNYTVLSSSTAPSLEFRGKWDNPDLALDDHGSLNRAFDPSGALVINKHMRPYIQEVVPLTLHEGKWSDFESACAALKQ
jgi:hypothetical protein